MRPKLSAPLGIDFKLTNHCNLNCIHCISNSGSKSNNELSLHEIKKTIEEIASMNIFYIGFTGGEPLMHNNIFHILKYSFELGLKIGLTTNGTLINSSTAKKLKNNGVWLVRVSLDGHNAELHDYFRGQKGSFIKTCNGIKYLLEAQLNVTILTVVSRHNLSEWEKMISLCESLGVNALNTYIFVPEGRGKQQKEMALSPEEYKAFLIRIREIQLSKTKINLITDAPLLCTLRNSDDSSACPAGMFDLFIMENGDVTPCPYFPITIGNIKRSSLKRIWNQSDILASIRDYNKLSDECRECEYIEACFGGCRAAAYCTYGTIEAPDPNCWLVSSRRG